MRTIDNISNKSMSEMIQAFPELLTAAKPSDEILEYARSLSSEVLRGICLLGMGGSAIAGDYAKSILARTSASPILAVRDYNLPACVDNEWVVIATSYSGNTEETISAFKEAQAKTKSIFAITTGGVLGKIAPKNGLTLIPSGLQPRAAFPILLSVIYPIMAAITDQENQDFDKLSANLRSFMQDWNASKISPKELATMIIGKLPVFVGWQHLAPVAYRAKCQVNENAKYAAFSSTLPESNHNEIESANSFSDIAVQYVFLRSDSAEDRINVRYDVTKRIYQRTGGHVTELHVSSESILEEALKLTCHLDMTSLELARIRDVNPTNVELISELKDFLAESQPGV